MIQALLPVVGEVIRRVLPDKDAQVKAQTELNTMLLDGSLREYEKQAEIIISEAKSDHWLTANWRPLLMLVFIIILANNYIFAPYLEMLFNVKVVLEVPEQMWQLLNLGVSGYIVGRSGEKIAKVWKEK